MDTMKDTKMQPATDAVIDKLRKVQPIAWIYEDMLGRKCVGFERPLHRRNTHEPLFSAATHAVVMGLVNQLEAAERERDDAKAAAENIALKLDYLRSKLETAEHAQNDWLRANAPGGWIDNLRIENEALRAEVIHIKEVEFPRKAQAVADGWRGKCERLEAKIAEMEQQAPAYWGPKHAIEGGSTTVIVGKFPVNPTDTPLYALPGAQGEEK